MKVDRLNVTFDESKSSYTEKSETVERKSLFQGTRRVASQFSMLIKLMD
jgi:hypothetical protein